MRPSSIQRRHERYKILYIYKIKECLVPNLPAHPLKQESFALQFRYNTRTGTANTTRKSSFALTASKLWNCLPVCISNISTLPLHIFKRKFDKFLEIFPDEPRYNASSQYYDSNTGSNSNSIIYIKSNPRVKSKIGAFNNLNHQVITM